MRRRKIVRHGGSGKGAVPEIGLIVLSAVRQVNSPVRVEYARTRRDRRSRTTGRTLAQRGELEPDTRRPHRLCRCRPLPFRDASRTRPHLDAAGAARSCGSLSSVCGQVVSGRDTKNLHRGSPLPKSRFFLFLVPLPHASQNLQHLLLRVRVLDRVATLFRLGFVKGAVRCRNLNGSIVPDARQASRNTRVLSDLDTTPADPTRKLL